MGSLEYMDKKPLLDLGLSNAEIEIYLSSIKLGLSGAGKLIKDTGLQSSTVYHSLDSLISRGVISFEIIKEKKAVIEKQEKNLQTLIPQLSVLAQIQKMPSQQVLVFEGWNGVLNAFKEAYRQITPGEKICAYTITKEFGGADPEQVRWLINKIRQLREDINRKSKKKIQ